MIAIRPVFRSLPARRVFHQVAPAEAPCPFKDLSFAEKALVSVWHLKSSVLRLAHPAIRLSARLDGKNANLKTAKRRLEIQACPADQIAEIRRRNSIVMKEKKNCTLGQASLRRFAASHVPWG